MYHSGHLVSRNRYVSAVRSEASWEVVARVAQAGQRWASVRLEPVGGGGDGTWYGSSGMTMTGLRVFCRLRDEAWASQCCETKPCATSRVGRDKRLSDAMTLAVAHERDGHDLGERREMDLGFLGSVPRH